MENNYFTLKNDYSYIYKFVKSYIKNYDFISDSFFISFEAIKKNNTLSLKYLEMGLFLYDHIPIKINNNVYKKLNEKEKLLLYNDFIKFSKENDNFIFSSHTDSSQSTIKPNNFHNIAFTKSLFLDSILKTFSLNIEKFLIYEEQNNINEKLNINNNNNNIIINKI